MGFLKRLFGQSGTKQPAAPELRLTTRFFPAEHERHAAPPFVNRRAPIPPDGVKLKGKGRVDVSGESHHEAALLTVTGGRTQSGVNIGVLAALVPEPANPRDPQAVAVRVDGMTVGYLGRSDARAYRKVLEKSAAQGKGAYCNATIRGGWDRGGNDRGDFGVTLELGPPDLVLTSLDP